MPEIILTEEQLKVLNEAGSYVVVKTPDGDTYGTLDAADAAMIAKARERMANIGNDGLRSEVVMEMLQKLQDEDDRCGGLDLSSAESAWNNIKSEVLGNG